MSERESLIPLSLSAVSHRKEGTTDTVHREPVREECVSMNQRSKCFIYKGTLW